MLVNTSYRNKELTLEINALVGKPYGVFAATRWKGIGSPRLKVAEASADLSKYLRKIETGEFCNIEIRPGGVIIRFRYYLDNMAWVIPHYQLAVYKSGSHYSIHGKGNHLQVTGAYHDSKLDSFMTKIIEAKAKFSADNNYNLNERD